MSTVLEQLQALNPELNIRCVCDPAFRKYGNVHKGFNVQPLIDFLKKNIEIPADKTAYIASIPEAEESLDLYQEVSDVIYGGMPIEIGMCSGHNVMMNGMEWHKGNEVIVATSDTVLFLGCLSDIDFTGEKITYNSNKVETFFLPEGEMIELYDTCLHLAPMHAKAADGFLVSVILPRGTNLPLDKEVSGYKGEPELLKAKNKWLITHPDRNMGYMGIEGPNLQLKSL